MAYNTSNRSERLLQGRRFTTDNLTLSQEAFTDVFDLGAGEIFTDDGLIPSGSSQLLFSGSSQDGLIVSASTVDPTTYPEGSTDDLDILKFHYRKKLKGAADGQREVYYFTTSDPSAHDDYVTSDQLIESDQQTNFVSPKYIISDHSTRNAESITPGYKVAVSYGNDENNVTAATDDQFVFDYKTGVLTWVGSPPHDGNDFVFITTYQYIGRTLRSQIDDGTIGGGSGFPFSGSAVITGSLTVSGSTSTDIVDFTNISVISGSTFSGSFVGDGSGLTGLTVDASTVNLGGVLGGTAAAATFANAVVSGSGADNQVAIFNGGTSNIDGSSNLTFDGRLLTAATASITQNLTVGGNLTVQGTTTTVNSTEVELGDRILVLNAALAGGSGNAGINVHVSASDGSPAAHTGSFLWDDDEKYWKGGELGSEVKFLRETGDNILSSSAQIKEDISGSWQSQGFISASQVQENIGGGVVSSSGQINSLINDTIAATIVAEIDDDEIPIAKLAEDAVTITAGTGLKGGGSVTLGNSITINSDGLVSSSAQIKDDISGSLGTNASLIRSLTASTISGSWQSQGFISASQVQENIGGGVLSSSAQIKDDISGSLGTNATLIRSLTAAGISGSLGANATLIRTLTAAGISGSWQQQNFISASQVQENIGGGVVSSSAQIATDISGAIDAATGSLTTDKITEGSSNLYYTDARVKTKLNSDNVISGSGTDLDNEIAVFTGNGAVEGSSFLTFDSSTKTLTAATASITTNLTVGGDLTVNGTTTTVNSTVVNIDDNIIVVNYGGSETDAGIYAVDNVSTTGTGSLIWQGDQDFWSAGLKGAEKRVVTFNADNPTNDSFIHLNSSDEVVAIASGSEAGAFLQKTATGFEVSHIIDGGTY